VAVAVIHPDLPVSGIYRSDVVGAGGGTMLRFAGELPEEARHSISAAIKHRRRDDSGDHVPVERLR